MREHDGSGGGGVVLPHTSHSYARYWREDGRLIARSMAVEMEEVFRPVRLFICNLHIRGQFERKIPQRISNGTLIVSPFHNAPGISTWNVTGGIWG